MKHFDSSDFLLVLISIFSGAALYGMVWLITFSSNAQEGLRFGYVENEYLISQATNY